MAHNKVCLAKTICGGIIIVHMGLLAQTPAGGRPSLMQAVPGPS